jgi:hypothetical protein
LGTVTYSTIRPNDLASPAISLLEAGGVVSDGWARQLDDRPLLGSGHEFQDLVDLRGEWELHAALLAAIDQGVARLIASRR